MTDNSYLYMILYVLSVIQFGLIGLLFVGKYKRGFDERQNKP